MRNSPSRTDAALGPERAGGPGGQGQRSGRADDVGDPRLIEVAAAGGQAL
jgi:hypothetical protein